MMKVRSSSRGVTLSTIHGAKGQEAERVYLLQPRNCPCPHPYAKTPWAIEQEWNLMYVAITRAKKELVWVN